MRFRHFFRSWKASRRQSALQSAPVAGCTAKAVAWPRRCGKSLAFSPVVTTPFMTFIFALQCGIAYSSIGILHGGNARHLPLVPQGFSFIIPVQRGVLLVPTFLRFLIITLCLRLRIQQVLLAFLFLKFVQLLLIVFSLGRRHRPGRFSVARDFFLQCRDLFIERVFPPDIQHPIPCPLRRITDSIPCSFNPAQIVVYVPIRLFISSEYADMAIFAASATLPCSPSTLICSSWVAVRKCSVLSSSFAAFTGSSRRRLNWRMVSSTDCPTFSCILVAVRDTIAIACPVNAPLPTTCASTPAASCCVTPFPASDFAIAFAGLWFFRHNSRSE